MLVYGTLFTAPCPLTPFEIISGLELYLNSAYFTLRRQTDGTARRPPCPQRSPTLSYIHLSPKLLHISEISHTFNWDMLTTCLPQSSRKIGPFLSCPSNQCSTVWLTIETEDTDNITNFLYCHLKVSELGKYTTSFIAKQFKQFNICTLNRVALNVKRTNFVISKWSGNFRTENAARKKKVIPLNRVPQSSHYPPSFI